MIHETPVMTVVTLMACMLIVNWPVVTPETPTTMPPPLEPHAFSSCVRMMLVGVTHRLLTMKAVLVLL